MRIWRTGLVAAVLLVGHSMAVGSVAADPVVEDDARVCTAAPNPVNRFLDVPNDSLFCVDIAWMAESEITGGRADGTYGPSDPVRRGHMAAFLYRFAGQPVVADDAPTFTDVRSDHVFAAEISWLAQEEVSLGRGDGTFLPNDRLTRGQMSAFLYRFAGEPTVLEEGLQFPDVPADHHFAEAVAWMASTGITTGLADGTFGVDQPLNRGQMSAFLYRYDQHLATDTPPTDPQVPVDWLLEDRDIQITLVWSGGEQLTLRVTDPSGEQIYPGSPTASSGGVMDRLDAPSCDAVEDIHGQNVSWPAGTAPTGTYRAEVTMGRECPYDGWFRLEVRRRGELLDTISAPTNFDRGDLVDSTIEFTLETADPTPAPDPDPEPDAEPEPEPETDPETDPEPAPEPETDPEADPEPAPPSVTLLEAPQRIAVANEYSACGLRFDGPSR